jgi:glycosyltransferase involved in cell wall biosynthesis
VYSVIIPAYNESEKIIKDTVDRFKKTLINNNYEFEIIVINDGSDDEINLTDVKIINHSHNLGYGRALKTGITHAKFDIIIICDADGTYPIEKAPELIKSYKKNYDMVVGSRQGDKYDESISKRILIIILKFLVEYTAGRTIPDINSGFRIFSKKKTLPYFNYLCNTFSFTTSLTLAFMMNSLTVNYIPINYELRDGKSKVRLFRDSLRTFQFIIEAMVYYNPVKVFFGLFLFIFLFSIILILVAFFSDFMLYSIILLGLFFIFIIIFSFALISIQLKQLLFQSKNYDE